MARQMWIDADNMQPSDCGFLVRVKHQNRDARYDLREEPARTNMSHRPCFKEWCGSTNNVSVEAMGVWKTIKASRSGARALVEEVTDRAELQAFLDVVGYPELMPDEDE